MSTAFHRLALALSLSCALVVLVNAQSTPDQVQDPFRSSVDVVTIQASVRDARGRVVQGLTRLDFEVRDNGQLRPIIEFRSDRQSPVTLAILVDMSGSMASNPRSPWLARPMNRCCRSFGRGRSRPVHVRLVAPRAPGLHAGPLTIAERIVGVRTLRHDVAVRCDRGRGSSPCGPLRDTSRDGGVDRRDRHEQPPDGAGSVRTRGLHRRPGVHRGDRAFSRSTRDDGGRGAWRGVRDRGSSRSGGMDRRPAAIRQHA